MYVRAYHAIASVLLTSSVSFLRASAAPACKRRPVPFYERQRAARVVSLLICVCLLKQLIRDDGCVGAAAAAPSIHPSSTHPSIHPCHPAFPPLQQMGREWDVTSKQASERGEREGQGARGKRSMDGASRFWRHQRAVVHRDASIGCRRRAARAPHWADAGCAAQGQVRSGRGRCSPLGGAHRDLVGPLTPTGRGGSAAGWLH